MCKGEQMSECTAITTVEKSSAGLSAPLTESAKVLFASGMFPNMKGVSQALVKVMFGRALGLTPAESMWAIHFIPGKPPSLSSQFLAARVKTSPNYDYRVRVWSREICQIEFFERSKMEGKWEAVGVSTFSISEAKGAGLTNKDVWKAWPKSMLFSRALTSGVRTFAPDLTYGVPAYSHEEMGNDREAEAEARRVGWEQREDVQDAEVLELGDPSQELQAEDVSEVTAPDNFTPAPEEQVQRLLALAETYQVPGSKLREHLHWHDGVPLTVAAAKRGVDFILNYDADC